MITDKEIEELSEMLYAYNPEELRVKLREWVIKKIDEKSENYE